MTWPAVPKAAFQFMGGLCLVLAVLFVPPVLAHFFSVNGAFTSRKVNVALWLITGLFLCLSILFFRLRGKALLGPAMALCSTLVVLGCTVVADRLYGRWLMPETANLLFPPFSTAVQTTDEFEVKVHINNLGFRGPATQIKKTKPRVLAVGDSFTFGWGVTENESWVGMLDSAYPNLEVLNLGRGGAHPGDHVQLLRQALPLLKPDLVLVNILQGNDLNQLMRMIEYDEAGRPELPMPKQTNESGLQKLQRFLATIWPTLSKRFRPAVDIGDRWKFEADNFDIFLTDSIKMARYTAIPDKVKSVFLEGRLNPSLIYDAVHFPDLFVQANDTADALYKKGLIRLTDHLREMTELCATHQAQLVVLSLPNRPYTCAGCTPYLDSVGLTLSGLIPPLPLADHATKMAAQANGLTCLTFTAAMQAKCPSNELYFPFDGHWNAQGNRTFGRLAIEALNQNPQWKALSTSSGF